MFIPLLIVRNGIKISKGLKVSENSGKNIPEIFILQAITTMFEYLFNLSI